MSNKLPKALGPALIEQWMAERRQQDTKTEPPSASTEGLESA
jgi:hypothetical protein